MKIGEKLQKITADKKSNWLEEAAKRAANKTARTNSRKVAVRILQVLKDRGMSQTMLAEKLQVSRQQVGKIIKGEENFTFETIAKLEKVLQIRLMNIESEPKPEIGMSGENTVSTVYSTSLPTNIYIVRPLGYSSWLRSSENFPAAEKSLTSQSVNNDIMTSCYSNLDISFGSSNFQSSSLIANDSLGNLLSEMSCNLKTKKDLANLFSETECFEFANS